MKKALFICLLIATNCNGQFSSNNFDSGFVFSNDIVSKGNKLYVCGTFNRKVSINGTELEGNVFSAPFLSVKAGGNSSVHFPVIAIDGYAEFKHLYSHDNSVYITGIFTNNIRVNGDSIKASSTWNGFVIKLNDDDSVDWYRIIGEQNKNDYPSYLVFDDSKVYVAFNSTNTDSTITRIAALNASNGSPIWSKSFTNGKSQEIAGFQCVSDTIHLRYLATNTLYNVNLLTNGTIAGAVTHTNVFGHVLSARNNTRFINTEKVNGTYLLSSYANKQGYQKTDIAISDYFGACDIVEADSSVVVIAGFFQNQIIVDSTTYTESDTSNSFIISFDPVNGTILDMRLLPLKNVYKTHRKDSSLYFISNYLDGADKIKRSNEQSIFNNDFKVSHFNYLKPKKKNENISSSTKQKIVVYPNLNSGEQINICCITDGQVKAIQLMDFYFNELPSQYEVHMNTVTLKANQSLASGVYFIQLVLLNGETKLLKIIVN